MKIKYGIATGYEAKIAEHDSAEKWVNAHYGKWITANVTEDFTITDVTGLDFIVDFPSTADAVAFKEKLGGRIVE